MVTRVTSSADYLTDGILGLIRERNLRAGERLPSVDELASTFGVASPTVREVLRRLEATGALEIRHGSGIYVRRTVQPLVVANPHGEAVDAASLRDLLRARLLVEPALARLAAARVDGEGRVLLEASLASATSALASGPQGRQEGGLGVHRAVARVAGNAILADIIDSLLDVHAREQLRIQELYGSPRRDAEVHADIVAAILSGDGDAAEARMRDHLLDVETTVLARLGSAPEAPATTARGKGSGEAGGIRRGGRDTVGAVRQARDEGLDHG
jgi:GntR family transcriptional repressor for pyruvate dehydrogenase complex